MEYYYSSSSSSSSFTSKIVTAVITILLLVVTTTPVVESGSVVHDCGPTAPVTTGACSGSYTNCVANVITALRDTTPNKGNYIYTRSFPSEGVSGGVTGTGTCVYSKGLNSCQDCLANAHEWLHTNCDGSSSSGRYVNDDCTMYYSQIMS